MLQVLYIDLAHLELCNKNASHDGITVLRFLSQFSLPNLLARISLAWPSLLVAVAVIASASHSKSLIKNYICLIRAAVQVHQAIRQTNAFNLCPGRSTSNLCPLNNPDLLFSQPVKLADQGVYLATEGGLLMGCSGQSQIEYQVFRILF